jgi:membrane-bound metal-dependent hydrolase YbcI (DUF457 family)
MLIFGHIGLTLGVARALNREIDARWVAVASLLPDLIDKPLRVLAPAFTQGNTRTVGHALTVLLVCMALVAFPLRRTIRKAGGVALLLPVHLLLDGMWVPDMRVSLLWPWAGSAFPPLDEGGISGLWAHLVRDLADPVNLAGELGGLLVLGYLWHWCGLADAARWARLWHTGAFVHLPAGSKGKETSG